jgi:AAA domain
MEMPPDQDRGFAMNGPPFNPADFDYYPPGEPIDGKAWRNGARTQKRFELIPLDKIAFDTTPSYLVKNILPRVGLCVFWGPPKCGKSFLVFDLMMHVALGWTYRDRKVKQGAVVYCALEGCAAFKNRVEAFRLTRLADTANNVPFYLMASPLALVADHAALIASIRATLVDTKPAAVVIDTLNRSLAGSESDDRDMAAYVKAADAIRDAFDCAVVIVHHCGHEGTRPRGHSSLIGAVDAQIAIKRDNADNVIATIELMKDGQQGDEFTSRLEVVEVGIDDDGDKITSCVIETVEGRQPSRDDNVAKLTKGAKIALDALRDAIGECGEVPPVSNHIPSGVKCVTIDQWREYAIKRGISTSDKESGIRMAFGRATDCLNAARRVAIWDGYAWPT